MSSNSSNVRLTHVHPVRLSSMALTLGVVFTLTRPALSQPAAEPAPEPAPATAPSVAPLPPSSSPEASPSASPQTVAALPPRPTEKLIHHWEAGGWLGYGIQLDSEPTRPFGLTLGVRGGVVLPQRAYVGLALGVFGGQSSSLTYQGVRYTASLWQSQVGVEGGYELELGPLTLRPFLGVGVNHTTVSYSATVVFDSYREDHNASTDLYINPGALLHLRLTERIYAGLDSHLSLVTNSPVRSALTIAASGGVAFF